MIVRDAVTSELRLDNRGQAILAAIINEHLVTGEPVGSRTVAERCAHATAWSPATIRNSMAELEEAEFVEQPHTSAGRVPTDRGYRYFVDHLIGASAPMSRQDLAAVDSFMQIEPGDTDATRLMERISRLLSHLSTNVGIVVAPPLPERALQHIEFMRLADDRALVVMVFASNIVQHKIVRLDEPLTQDELERTARYLNAEFGGKSLAAIRAEILHLLQEDKRLYDQLGGELMRRAALLTERSLAGETEAGGDVFVDGAANILVKPDFADVRRLSDLLRTLEAKARLVEILDECLDRSAAASVQSMSESVRVRIGRENSTPAMQNCALITATYRVGIGDAAGTLGILTPMRIEYARMIAVVNYVARFIERSLSEAA